MIVFRFLERRRLRKLIETSNQKMLDEGLFAMQYVNSGSVTELRVNGRVLMLFPFGKKARAAIQCVTDLICLFKNQNVISLPKLKQIEKNNANANSLRNSFLNHRRTPLPSKILTKIHSISRYMDMPFQTFCRT